MDFASKILQTDKHQNISMKTSHFHPAIFLSRLQQCVEKLTLIQLPRVYQEMSMPELLTLRHLMWGLGVGTSQFMVMRRYWPSADVKAFLHDVFKPLTCLATFQTCFVDSHCTLNVTDLIRRRGFLPHVTAVLSIAASLRISISPSLLVFVRSRVFLRLFVLTEKGSETGSIHALVRKHVSRLTFAGLTFKFYHELPRLFHCRVLVLTIPISQNQCTPRQSQLGRLSQDRQAKRRKSVSLFI